MSDLFTPPRLFRNVKFHRHTDRSVGWLELFYDLVYIATLIQIGNYLSDNVNLLGFGQFLVMLAVVWWAWTGETFYQNRFVVDDLTHRILVFTQIFAVAALGLSVSGAFGELYIQFTIAYVFTRLMLVFMYVRVARTDPECAPFARSSAIGFGVGILAWLGSLLLPAGYHWIGWLIGIGIEFSIPLFPWMREQQRLLGTDLHHISERFGIFTIIVLGESFVKVLDDAQGSALGVEQIVISTSGLLVVYSLWWLYFTDTAGKVIDLTSRLKPVAWVYGHFPLAAGLVAFGVGAKKLFAATFDYPGQAFNPDYRMLYTSAVVLYLLALALIDIGLNDELTPQNQAQQASIHLVSAIIVALIGIFVTQASATVFVTLVSVVMVAQVVINIYQTRSESADSAVPQEPMPGVDFEQH